MLQVVRFKKNDTLSRVRALYQNYLFRIMEFSCKSIIVLSFNRPNVAFKNCNWNFLCIQHKPISVGRERLTPLKNPTFQSGPRLHMVMEWTMQPTR